MDRIKHVFWQPWHQTSNPIVIISTGVDSGIHWVPENHTRRRIFCTKFDGRACVVCENAEYYKSIEDTQMHAEIHAFPRRVYPIIDLMNVDEGPLLWVVAPKTREQIIEAASNPLFGGAFDVWKSGYGMFTNISVNPFYTASRLLEDTIKTKVEKIHEKMVKNLYTIPEIPYLTDDQMAFIMKPPLLNILEEVGI